MTSGKGASRVNPQDDQRAAIQKARLPGSSKTTPGARPVRAAILAGLLLAPVAYGVGALLSAVERRATAGGALPSRECDDGTLPPRADVPDAPLRGMLTGHLLLTIYSEEAVGDIYTMKADGTDLKPILIGSHDDSEAAWSLDGSHIAFTRGIAVAGGDPDAEIYVMDADGSRPAPLTENDFADTAPAWSPDGSTILFNSNRDGPIDAYALDTDGSDVTRLTNGGVVNSPAAWSRDGQRIALVKEEAVGNRFCLDGEVEVLHPDGSGPRRLTRNAEYELEPAWSPDGSTLAFQASHGDDHRWDIYVMDVFTGDVRRLTDLHGAATNPVWSPDGTMIAFTSNAETNADGQPDPQKAMSRLAVYVMNADGSGITRIRNVPSSHAAIHDWRD